MTGYIYDEGGEFLQTITGTVTQFEATAGGAYRGNVTTVRQYDVIQSGQKDEKLGYNNTGAVIFTRDPLGHQTDIGYTDSFSDGIVRNAYAYPTQVTDPDGRVASPQFFSTTQYNYDFGAVTTWSYNNRHLATTINYSAPVGTAETGSASFDYDAAGNRKWMIEAATASYGGGRVDYTWDTLSQLQSETRWFNELNRGYLISYGYNVAGQMTSLTSPFGHTVSYLRDKNGRLTDVSDTAAGGTTAYTSQIKYRAWDALKSLSYGNGLTQTRTHNPRQQLTSFLVTGRQAQYGAADVMKTEYQYHPDGQPKFADDKLDAKFTRGWEYDYAGRLAVARTGSESVSWLNNQPPSGNPTGPYKQTYTYNAWQEVTSREARFWSKTNNDNAIFTNARRQGWNYDAAGNVAGDGDSTYSFDANGRNTWIEGSNLVRVTQQHDGDGQVIKRVESEPNGPKPWHRTSFKTYYLRATGLGGQVLARLDQSGNPGSEDIAVGAADEVRRYVKVHRAAPSTSCPIAQRSGSGATRVCDTRSRQLL